MKTKHPLQQMVLAGLFLAIGYVLPFFTGQIKEIGNMLLPMHLPVLLCGLICGWRWGLGVGFVLPLTRSLFFGMPKLYPSALAMAFELAAYGFAVGLLFSSRKKQSLLSVYLSLIPAMLFGRLVWGAAQTLLLGLQGSTWSLAAFWAGGFVNALPGIALQLVLIPSILLVLDRTKLLPFRRE